MRYLFLTVIGLATTAAAQPPGAYYPGPVQQTGRLNEASTFVGGGGYNVTRPISPLIGGNRIVTGNVRGGFAFQGLSTIPDSNAFRAALPSSTLGGFERDSVSVADAQNLMGARLGGAYYNPSTTAFTRGFLSNYPSLPEPERYGLIRSQPMGVAPTPGLTGPIDMRRDPRLQTGFTVPRPSGRQSVTSLESQIVGTAPVSTPELSSSIFGPTALLPSGTLGELVQPRRLQHLQRPAGFDRTALPQDGPPQLPRMATVPGAQTPFGTPEDMARRTDLAQQPTGWDPRIQPEDPFAPRFGPRDELAPDLLARAGERREQSPDPARRERSPQPLSADAEPAPLEPPLPRLADVSMLPGYDRFTDMQIARALREEPQANWFDDMRAAIQSEPAVAAMLNEQAQMRSDEFVESMLNSPLQTFHGRGESPLNDELLKAESLMEIGQYYEAVRRYEAARQIDPLNPLPMIGKGNALLAAGEYSSAAAALRQGFARYPELVEFDLDLSRLLGGAEIVDIRRADLMQRLERKDNAELRFLLGYLEYYSGRRASGLENLERAAELERSPSIIGQLPGMLRGEGPLPPPQLPGGNGTVPSGLPGTNETEPTEPGTR